MFPTKNFANNFKFWDIMFGSYKSPLDFQVARMKRRDSAFDDSDIPPRSRPMPMRRTNTVY
jgi:sterol desaturase/sphingolipid hydroxylase (fatty acid hydroxylase superfamily)